MTQSFFSRANRALDRSGSPVFDVKELSILYSIVRTMTLLTPHCVPTLKMLLFPVMEALTRHPVNLANVSSMALHQCFFLSHKISFMLTVA